MKGLCISYLINVLKEEKWAFSGLAAIGVTPKFCVKSNERRNRAKFICRRQRHDRLPPMSTT